MAKRSQTTSGQYRQKRGDTSIGKIEKTYGVDFGVRSDTKLSTYLKEKKLPSLAKALDELKR